MAKYKHKPIEVEAVKIAAENTVQIVSLLMEKDPEQGFTLQLFDKKLHRLDIDDDGNYGNEHENDWLVWNGSGFVIMAEEYFEKQYSGPRGSSEPVLVLRHGEVIDDGTTLGMLEGHVIWFDGEYWLVNGEFDDDQISEKMYLNPIGRVSRDRRQFTRGTNLGYVGTSARDHGFPCIACSERKV
tara:strand:- start:3782 stop:4333 length:552 start_codon:yes stop_codon:yes gene_type:complete